MHDGVCWPWKKKRLIVWDCLNGSRGRQSGTSYRGLLGGSNFQTQPCWGRYLQCVWCRVSVAWADTAANGHGSTLGRICPNQHSTVCQKNLVTNKPSMFSHTGPHYLTKSWILVRSYDPSAFSWSKCSWSETSLTWPDPHTKRMRPDLPVLRVEVEPWSHFVNVYHFWPFQLLWQWIKCMFVNYVTTSRHKNVVSWLYMGIQATFLLAFPGLLCALKNSTKLKSKVCMPPMLTVPQHGNWIPCYAWHQ